MRTLATDEVLTANINDDAVTTAKVLDDAVTTAKVLDDAVTAAKLADSAYLANRNIVINGAMQVAQRSASLASVTTGGYKTLDRWKLGYETAGTWTLSRDSESPDGFGNSFKFDCTTANASLSSNSFLAFSQQFEGQDLQQLKKGTASAESVTLSFWVRSTLTGTHIVELYDQDNNRQISGSYTISVADTWEKKSITYAGDTTGAFDDDNAKSLFVQFWLAAGTDYSSGTLNTSWASATGVNRAVGQVNTASSTSNNFYITGIQLEVGSTATPFEHKTYADELRACQRYFEKQVSGSAYGEFGNGYAESASQSYINVKFAVEKRANPSYVGAALRVVNQGAAMIVTGESVDQGGTQMTKLSLTGSGGLTTARATMCSANNNATANMQWDAEL